MKEQISNIPDDRDVKMGTFDDQAVCDVCCGQNGIGAYGFMEYNICYDCFLGFKANQGELEWNK